MTTADTTDGPREWMRGYFSQNKESFRQRNQQLQAVDWGNPNLMIGDYCLGLIGDAIKCFAGDEPDLAESILKAAQIFIAEANSRFGDRTELDFVGLDRIQIVVASRLGSVLAPEIFEAPLPVPFDAFARYLEGDEGELEESNAAQFAWALLSVLERRLDEFDSARGRKTRKHPDLRKEMALMPSLASLIDEPQEPTWRQYEVVLARWLNPTLRTNSYASDFRPELSALLALVWTKYRMECSKRESLLGTVFGENLSVPVSLT